MTALDMGLPIDSAPDTAAASAPHDVRVEPTLGLEWSQALEPAGSEPATGPAQARNAWVHRAQEKQVLALYQLVSALDADVPAPWWLRALADHGLRSRSAGFAVEDRVARLLDSRSGWVFVPWGSEGETGYWEYMPSERALDVPGVPTTLLLTARHRGWIDVFPVHAGDTPAPIAVDGLADLRANLARIEALSPLG